MHCCCKFRVPPEVMRFLFFLDLFSITGLPIGVFGAGPRPTMLLVAEFPSVRVPRIGHSRPSLLVTHAGITILYDLSGRSSAYLQSPDAPGK